NQVVALDIAAERVEKINAGESPLEDADIQQALRQPGLNFYATLSPEEAYRDAAYAVIATPTDYDPETNRFNTSSIEAVVRDIQRINPETAIVIKSTVPVGYTRSLREETGSDRLF